MIDQTTQHRHAVRNTNWDAPENPRWWQRKTASRPPTRVWPVQTFDHQHEDGDVEHDHANTLGWGRIPFIELDGPDFHHVKGCTIELLRRWECSCWVEDWGDSDVW